MILGFDVIAAISSAFNQLYDAGLIFKATLRLRPVIRRHHRVTAPHLQVSAVLFHSISSGA